MISQTFEKFINTFENRIFIAGDFIAKRTYYGSRLITPNGRQLYYFFWKTLFLTGSSTINFDVIRNVKRASMELLELELLELFLDHSLVIMKLASVFITSNNGGKLTTKSMTWLNYIAVYLQMNTLLKEKGEVDKPLSKFPEVITMGGQLSTPCPFVGVLPKTITSKRNLGLGESK